MPGSYLAAILVSAGGVVILDARWRLAAWRDPARTAAAVAIGTLFFLAWDVVGIATGVFVKGDSPLVLGIDLVGLRLAEDEFMDQVCAAFRARGGAVGV